MTAAEHRPATDEQPTREPARRVRVSHPRVDGVRRPPRRTVSAEIDEQTDLGWVYVSALLRSQLRFAALVCGLATGGLAAVAITFAVNAQLAGSRVLGLPLAWLVLGVLIYPGLIGLGWYAVRHAERTETDFVELVRRR